MNYPKTQETIYGDRGVKSIYLDADLIKKVQHLADVEQVSFSKMTSRLLRKALAQEFDADTELDF